jgi:hypothetical protein
MDGIGQKGESTWIDEGGWYRFLNTRDEVVGTIDYVDKNPIKIDIKP